MDRTSLGNSPYHESIVCELWELRSSVKFLIEDLRAEPEASLTNTETWLAAEAQALGYLTDHFLCVFEQSIRGLNQLRHQTGQDPADTDEPMAVDVAGDDPEPAGELHHEGLHDHISCRDDGQSQPQPIVLKLCPWTVSDN
jgi:hypothetical protein